MNNGELAREFRFLSFFSLFFFLSSLSLPRPDKKCRVAYVCMYIYTWGVVIVESAPFVVVLRLASYRLVPFKRKHASASSSCVIKNETLPGEVSMTGCSKCSGCANESNFKICLEYVWAYNLFISCLFKKHYTDFLG